MPRTPPPLDGSTHFDVWGCRGSRNLVPGRSGIASSTSSYSALYRDQLFVLDAGRGLAWLGEAMRNGGRFRGVRRVYVLVSHAHLDHWEGLKDVEWFWQRGNGLEVRVLGTAQAISAIRSGYGHPSYVALELLGRGTVEAVRYETLRPRERRMIGGWRLETASLNHHSGQGRTLRRLHTLGFRLTAPDGAVCAYLSDHEPTPRTLMMERSMLAGAHIAVYDAHFPDVRDQAHGHGSQEHAARMARAHPEVIVLAGHHGPLLSDDEIESAHRRHGRGVANFRLAVEGRSYRWEASAPGFREVTVGR